MIRTFDSISQMTGSEKTQNDGVTSIAKILNVMWEKISYHLGLSSAKRLIIIPQLRFYYAQFCLMGKHEDSMSNYSMTNYPLLNYIHNN